MFSIGLWSINSIAFFWLELLKSCLRSLSRVLTGERELSPTQLENVTLYYSSSYSFCFGVMHPNVYLSLLLSSSIGKFSCILRFYLWSYYASYVAAASSPDEPNPSSSACYSIDDILHLLGLLSSSNYSSWELGTWIWLGIRGWFS